MGNQSKHHAVVLKLTNSGRNIFLIESHSDFWYDDEDDARSVEIQTNNNDDDIGDEERFTRQ